MMNDRITNRRVYNSTILDTGFYLQLFDDQGKKANIVTFREFMMMKWFIKSKIYAAMMDFGILDQYGRINVPFNEVPDRLYWGWNMEHMGESQNQWSLNQLLHYAFFKAEWLPFPDWVKVFPEACISVAIDELASDCELNIPRVYNGKENNQDNFTFITRAYRDEIKGIKLDTDVTNGGTMMLRFEMVNCFGNPAELCFRSNTARMNAILERLLTGDQAKETLQDLILYVGAYHKLKAVHKLLFSVIYTPTEEKGEKKV